MNIIAFERMAPQYLLKLLVPGCSCCYWQLVYWPSWKDGVGAKEKEEVMQFWHASSAGGREGVSNRLTGLHPLCHLHLGIVKVYTVHCNEACKGKYLKFAQYQFCLHNKWPRTQNIAEPKLTPSSFQSLIWFGRSTFCHLVSPYRPRLCPPGLAACRALRPVTQVQGAGSHLVLFLWVMSVGLSPPSLPTPLHIVIDEWANVQS